MTPHEEALDPTTPPARLAALVDHELEAVLENPALPLLLVERPDFWGELSSEAQASLAARSPCPPAFLEWLRTTRRDDAPRTEAVRNPSVPIADRRAIFLALPIDTDWARVFGALQAFLSAADAELLRRAWDDRLPRTSLTEAEVAQLIMLGGMGLYLALQEPACPAELLESSYRDLEIGRFIVLDHPRLPAWCLADALRSTDEEVRAQVASNPALPAPLQLQLAADASARVRESLRFNERVTPEARRRLDEMDGP